MRQSANEPSPSIFPATSRCAGMVEMPVLLITTSGFCVIVSTNARMFPRRSRYRLIKRGLRDQKIHIFVNRFVIAQNLADLPLPNSQPFSSIFIFICSGI